MNFYERASKGSDRHRAIVNADSVQLLPIDGSPDAIERFQPIAREAIENEGDGYKMYPPPRYSSRDSHGLCLTVVMVKTQ